MVTPGSPGGSVPAPLLSWCYESFLRTSDPSGLFLLSYLKVLTINFEQEFCFFQNLFVTSTTLPLRSDLLLTKNKFFFVLRCL